MTLPGKIEHAIVDAVQRAFDDGMAEEQEYSESLSESVNALRAAILAWGEGVREGALREADMLRSALADAVEAIDRAEPMRHSPWCNGVHEGGCCEGDYLMTSFMERLRALASRPEPEPAPENEGREPILWLGDNTEDRWIWEMTRRRDRFTILGGPTTLYFKMDDGTNIIVPHGWWIYDWHTDHPRVSSARPSPRSETTEDR